MGDTGEQNPMSPRAQGAAGAAAARAGNPIPLHRPLGRDAAEPPAPEMYFNVNLALRQLFLIFKLFHINPWPDICFL